VHILPFDSTRFTDASVLWTQKLKILRQHNPMIPDTFTHPPYLIEKLDYFQTHNQLLMAVQDGNLLGYMGWYLVEQFRGARRKAAYVPEWGHFARVDHKTEIYQALYRAASQQWSASGCEAHAITLLADDPSAKQIFFWSGFGLIVIDSIRTLDPISTVPAHALTIRPATPEDAIAYCQLDEEHCHHYTDPPIFMPLKQADDPQKLRQFLIKPLNRLWLAFDENTPVGYMRFDAYDFDCTDIIQDENVIGINGAYVRPAYRGRHVAANLLSAGINAYRQLGFASCAVDFESINPEAANFWPRYFSPVCHSLLRIPENI
jgi:predicted N-acetyltransferase YhbS